MKVNGNRFKRAREILGLTQANVADLVGVQQSTIARIEQNVIEPSDALVEGIAFRLGFDKEFFYQPPGPEFPFGSLLYRKRSALKSADQSRLHQMAWAAFILYDHMAKRLKRLPTLRLPTLNDEPPEIAAQLTRDALGCEPDTPIDRLLFKLEQCGLCIFAVPDNVEDYDAFALWADKRKPVIVVNTDKPGDRIRWTTAHEAGHLVMHHSLQGGTDDAEKEADHFASALLMPAEAMEQAITRPVTLSSLAELKLRWGVSIQALLRRARDLVIITEHQYKHLVVQQSRLWGRKQEPENLAIKPERPRALRKMAEELYGNPINYQKLAREVYLPTMLVKRIVQEHATKEDLARSWRQPSQGQVVNLRTKRELVNK